MGSQQNSFPWRRRGSWAGSVLEGLSSGRLWDELACGFFFFLPFFKSLLWITTSSDLSANFRGIVWWRGEEGGVSVSIHPTHPPLTNLGAVLRKSAVTIAVLSMPVCLAISSRCGAWWCCETLVCPRVNYSVFGEHGVNPRRVGHTLECSSERKQLEGAHLQCWWRLFPAQDEKSYYVYGMERMGRG